MKLLVKKESDDNISMKIEINGQEKDFDYVDFVDSIYNQDKIEDIDFAENINDWEKGAINSLINKINELVDEEEESPNVEISAEEGNELSSELIGV